MQPVFRNLLPLLPQPPGESKPLSLGINSSLQCWDTVVQPSYLCRLQSVLYWGSCVYSFQPECSFQISAVFPHRVNSDPLLLSLINVKQLRLFSILQDEQNPKMFPSLPASSTLCKWFRSEEAARFGSFSVFLAWWASKILIIKVVGQLLMCCWKCCQVWDDPTRLFEGGGCWQGLVGNDLHLQLSYLRWEVPGTIKAMWLKGSVHYRVQAGNSKTWTFPLQDLTNFILL